MDLTRLPTGARAWAELVAWAAASDDRLERYFLELKSDVDLNSKRGQHKVAKFVLGAANRDAVQAARRLGGHAVMLIGVSPGAASGVPGFEARDLQREVERFTGIGGPVWDYERIPVEGGRDVIAIVVDPPTGEVWPCLADGVDMHDGDVYVRKDGSTQKATGPELRAMLSRQPNSDVSLPEVDVEVIGEALSLRFDEDDIRRWVEATAHGMLGALGHGGGPYETVLRSFARERRSEDEFRREVQMWRDQALGDPAHGLESYATQITRGIAIRVRNHSRVSLRDVLIEIEFTEPVRAIEWQGQDKESLRLFPDRPLEWGMDTAFLAPVHLAAVRGLARVNRDGGIGIELKIPAQLSVSLSILRPEQTYVTSDSEVILVLLGSSSVDGPIAGSWSLTAGDVNDVRRGSLAVPVVVSDIGDVLREPSDGSAR